MQPNPFMPPIHRRPPLFEVDKYEWPDEWRILLMGQTGSGKTYLAKRLMDQKYGKVPIVVYQSKPRVASLDRLAVKRVATVAALQSELKRREIEPMIILKPSPEAAMDRETTEAFSKVVFEAKVPLLIYIDEIAGFTRFSPVPAKWFGILITQGRELDKGVIMAAQEPAWLPRLVYAECQAVGKLYTSGEANDKAIVRNLPTPVALTPVPDYPHGLVWWDSRDRTHAYQFRRCQ